MMIPPDDWGKPEDSATLRPREVMCGKKFRHRTSAAVMRSPKCVH